MPYDVNKRLSEDVLRMIMWDYVFTEELQSLGQISIIWNPKPLPFDAVVISSICKKWRRVALDHPTLWSQIHFRWPRTTILMYMARRRQMPLSIAIDERAWNADEFPAFGLTLSDTLETVERISIEWCHGWYTDKCAPAGLISWVFSLLTKKMSKPKLRELELRFNGFVRSDISLDFPELSNINVRNISLKAFRPSWHRLTDVIVNSSDLTLSEILGFLGAAQMLEDIVLYHRDRRYIRDEDDDAEVAASKLNDPPTSLPNLKHFKIHWCSDQFADQILRRIRFPSSSSVVLSIARREDDSIFESLPRFVADNLRSAHTLRIDVHTDEYVPFPAFLLFFQTADSPSYRLQFNEGDHLLLTPNDRAEVIYPQGNALLADLTSIIRHAQSFQSIPKCGKTHRSGIRRRQCHYGTSSGQRLLYRKPTLP
ncbi:hypothetical protein SISNIDRAFT_35839 [Sistotremastrum niveocremeum HHB9708]|uniref:F-box domain-containing protein n=1 Tax=Sistotremastrum niveocremeum HHB9708 TaxID=1314777 RepID=A0A164WDR6_9AGAM|nr:hypothetical protein SISNIDRAFT_35839 [Sistotremastrum niveocremeum HHB9708]